MTTNKNSARASCGAETIIRYLEREPGLDPWEAATDAITDILHAYCDRGDELGAEELGLPVVLEQEHTLRNKSLFINSFD